MVWEYELFIYWECCNNEMTAIFSGYENKHLQILLPANTIQALELLLWKVKGQVFCYNKEVL